ncbi:glutamate receptor 1.4 [Rosa chinensis]|uniref:glutamate receptor 1.4 n=1 Tax=Rosa chinensis TaxID=74649 RepID=UPI000D08EAB6|nr:glutamate receptor 1.4 [Rosa chinensis]
MEFPWKKQTILCLTFFCLLLGDSYAATDEKVHHNTPIITEEAVHVGAILDMRSREGSIVLSCISMALSDFYYQHSNYSTRVILHSRDSNKGNPLHAVWAALNLLDKIKVEAIIGAQTSMEASLLAELGEATKVPVMSLSQPSHSLPSNKYSFFVEITLDETSEVMGITALVEALKCRDIVLLYENTKYGRDMIPSLINSFQQKNINISYRSFIAPTSTNEQITEELRKLKALNSKTIVLHVSHLIVPRIFLNAKKLRMMSEDYDWIMTSMSMNFLHSINLSVTELMQGVVGLRSYVPASTTLHNLTSRLRPKFYKEEEKPHVEVRELNADGIRAYDATWALAEAVERSRKKFSTTRKQNIRLNPRHLIESRSSKHGVVLLREILQSRLKGLRGEIKYINGRLFSGAFEIVNVIGEGEIKRVGLWPCEKRSIEEWHLFNNRRSLLSTHDLETNKFFEESPSIMKGSKKQLMSSEKKLRIGVPVKVGFKEFVRMEHDIETNTTHITGFSIDVFKAAIRGLPYKVHYEFIPFEDSHGNMAGTYNDLVQQVYLKKYDAVVGDTTISANRSLYVDFTIPYTDLGVGVLVRKDEENMWVFLKPLSADLWITSAAFFILTGLVVWIIERPINQEFQGSLSQQIGTIFWFSFSTLVFAHREKLLNNLTKFVVIIWVFVVLILSSSYTANLASMMTMKQIQMNSKVNYIVYQISSFTKLGFIDFTCKGLKKFDQTEEAYVDALSRGSKHGGVSAIIDEIPYIKIFLAKYSSKYSMIKTKSTTNGFGFVFPKGSKLVHDISRQIEILREEGKLVQMEEDWFHSIKTDLMFDDTTSDPNPLNLHSFRGLFLVSGVSSVVALILFTIFLVKEKWHVVKTFKVGYVIRAQLQHDANGNEKFYLLSMLPNGIHLIFVNSHIY